jgi:predicted small metal-binding protein
MRVIDCECGALVQAANDQELARNLRNHAEEQHPESAPSEDHAEHMVAERAYTATDA